MENQNDAFTAGIWTVMKGKEEEFIKEWSEFAKWSNNAFDKGYAHLLQDTENPQKFISFGKWDNFDSIQKWREKPEFKDAMSRVSKLLTEPVIPNTMKEVAKVGDVVTV